MTDLSRRLFLDSAQFGRDTRGQEMIEYGLISALMACILVVFIPYVVIPSMSTIYSKVLVVASRLVP